MQSSIPMIQCHPCRLGGSSVFIFNISLNNNVLQNDQGVKTVWPSGLRRWLKAPFRKGVGSNPTAVTFLQLRHNARINSCHVSQLALGYVSFFML